MLTKQEEKKIGKFLSLVLRHKPEVIGVELDENGWTDIETLMVKLAAKGKAISRDDLQQIVVNNNKKRYAISEDGKRIRARQGHSIKVDLGYEPVTPPEFLFHGTAAQHIHSIKATGLEKRNRHHVHLSLDKETATQVGGRHGKPVILVVKAGEMYEKGNSFFVSENGVWLTEEVPVEFIVFPD
ncbi:MAG: RNA 2'-phosphotransferase [Bacteroidetes bacterium]|nr:RNA 2'-phosphotransferase [Bacteroidota bacterium]MCB0843363.1 RNA 2'-phosphotransferase [Bacteroidota bacterium]MCB0850857.1 RNA 2'-phosphotransferase [Bacteroidota bacterium]